jgi:hypothetical protein
VKHGQSFKTMAITINGTTGVAGVDGSASTPAVQGTDSNTGINFGSDILGFSTGGTERSRFDSNGNLLIGNTSHNNGAFGGNTRGINVAGIQPQVLLHETDTDKDAFIGVSGSQFFVHTGDSIPIRFGTADTERMRIDSSGNVGIGTTQPNNADSADGGLQINPNLSNGSPQIAFKRASTGNTSYAMVFVNGNVGVGSIGYTNSGTSFNTSSDYRLKENVTAISDGITRLKTLKPSRFNFKVDTDTTVDGFLAHEVTAVPEAITGTKDAVDSDNKPIYQGIDQSKLVPLLTAALQEAITKIETLETKVAALEAG